MKKKILIIVGIFSLFAVAGGAGLIYSIQHSSSHLHELIMLHQVEIQREHLLLNIHQVQEDLYSQTTTHPESAEAMKNHASSMETAIKACFACHHTQDVTDRLSDLQHQIYQLKEALVLSTRDRPFPRRASKSARHWRFAHQQGQHHDRADQPEAP